jgi:N-hydroxyarylamine O-acetyltransferase
MAVPLTSDHLAYLARLGVDPEPPSVEALVRLVGANTSRIPWETLWIHLGDSWPTDPAESVARIGARGRGGYCYHLNGGFSDLLGALGYSVQRHLGGVHNAPEADLADLDNHLVLTVDGLPSDANPEGCWYVDVGLGDTLHEPLPLRAATHRSGPYEIALETTDGTVGDWHLRHDPTGSFRGMSWSSAPTEMDAFAERHAFLHTSPESPFVQLLLVQRRESDASDRLMGLTLERLGAGATSRTLDRLADLEGALVDVFGLDLSPTDRERLAERWPGYKESHDAWQSALAAPPPPDAGD